MNSGDPSGAPATDRGDDPWPSTEDGRPGELGRNEQESTQRAVRSRERAEKHFELDEQWLPGLFAGIPVGIALCDLDGTFLETNPALRDTLGYSEQELAERTVHDLFVPEEVETVSESFTQLARGTRAALRERRNLVRADGDTAWTYLAVSVLHDEQDRPRRFVTMVEDLRELSSLQDRLQYQVLYDRLTGLANRQHFGTRLEGALLNLPGGTVLTLYRLRLDGFELINDGLGYDAGDELVQAVAQRLQTLIEDEVGLVARIGGTEFAILLKQTPTTPGVAAFAESINEELGEPLYVAGYGIASSAGIGVVQRTVGASDTGDMMWAADVSLRHAQAAGKRQWALFDPELATGERIEAKLAAMMPGALELGEFEVHYRPLRSFCDGSLVAVEAQLSWQPTGERRLGHAECLRLAERSGITLALRDWMLETAWNQMAEWHLAGYRLWLVAGLSPNQSRDPDLVTKIRQITGRGELDPDRLRVCLSLTALVGDGDEARENVGTLTEMGLQTAVRDFRCTPQELRYLRESPARVVLLAPEVVQMVHEQETDEAPEVRAVAGILPLVRDCGMRVAVADVDTPEQARWWEAHGCDIGAGPIYGDPVSADELSELLDADSQRS